MSAPVQRPLFPDGHELHAEALAALRQLDVDRAIALVQRAQAIDARLVDADHLLLALRWLQRRAPLDGDRLGDLLLAVAADAIAGALTPAAAEFLDAALARQVLARPAAGPFLDAGERVPRAVASLLCGDAAQARAELLLLLAQGPFRRSTPWGYLGDADHRLQRADSASACYVRALLLDAGGVDLWRLAHTELRAGFFAACAEHGEALARELLLTHAWLEGWLRIPPANGWFDARSLPPAAGPERRFAQLLYLDQSAPRGEVDLDRREAMAATAPALFERYMQACRSRERS